MKQSILFLFIFSSFKSYCQENALLPYDSLLKVNKVKKALMRSKKIKGNGSGETIYYYNKSGDLIKNNSLSPISNDPIFITDYFFDNSGRRYASIIHGGESYSNYSTNRTGFALSWHAGFPDSIVFYYEYNKEKQYSRMYRNYPSGELMYESVYLYGPRSTIRKSYDKQQRLISETDEYYEKEQFIVKSISKRYDSSGQVVLIQTQDFQNTYNGAGQLTEINYRDDTCSCISHHKYYPNGLIKSITNVNCSWNQKFTYKYY